MGASSSNSPAQAAELERAVRDAAAGSGAAWSLLVERFAARLCTVARSHRLAAHDVEDVVQSTWLRLLEHVDSVQRPVAVGAWLETTTRRESLRVLMMRRRECPTDADHLERERAEPVDSDALVAAERRAAVAAALGSLPPRQRELLRLLMAERRPSYAEISRALRMPIGSIGPTRERGFERLRRTLDDVDDVDDVDGADEIAA